MVVVLTHKEISCLVVEMFDNSVARFRINIGDIKTFLPALFALIRSWHEKGSCLSPKSYNLLQQAPIKLFSNKKHFILIHSHRLMLLLFNFDFILNLI